MFWVVLLARHVSGKTASGQTGRYIHQDAAQVIVTCLQTSMVRSVG